MYLIVDKIYSCVNAMNASDLWHSRLCHVNDNPINRIVNLDLIPIHDLSGYVRCEVCVKSKLPRKSLKQEYCKAELLNLVYSDLCEMNGHLSRSGKRYFITFREDYSK